MDTQMNLSESPPWARAEESIPILAPNQLPVVVWGASLNESSVL